MENVFAMLFLWMVGSFGLGIVLGHTIGVMSDLDC